MSANRRAPLVAIVGRPNVGKSTLYNRLIGGRPALVHDTPGLTRDRRYGEFDLDGHRVRLVDTGGLDPDAEKDVIGAGIHRQARAAVDEAQAILFVVDAAAGITPGDEELVPWLRRLDRPIVVVANKVDSPKRDDWVHAVHELGLAEVVGVSAAHGRGVDELLETLAERLGLDELPPEPEEEGDSNQRAPIGDRPVRVALVGKPNAGKSSLCNRLTGTERSLVHHVPGTTTDPVDTEIEFGDRKYILVDTAGIRRKAKVKADIEKLSVVLALDQIRRADVVVLVIDGVEGPSEQDARLAGAIEESGKPVVIALNKSDLLSGAGAATALRKKVKDELHFISYATYHFLSATRGDGVVELLQRVDHAAAQAERRVPTAELNRFFAEVLEHHPPPIHRGRAVRIHYLTQGGVRPPTFLLFANRPRGVSPAYRRYVVNQLRERYQFEATPLRVIIKEKRSGDRRPQRGRARGRGGGGGGGRRRRGPRR